MTKLQGILEECFKKFTEEMSDEDSDGTLTTYDYIDQEAFIAQAIKEIEGLVPKDALKPGGCIPVDDPKDCKKEIEAYIAGFNACREEMLRRVR